LDPQIIRDTKIFEKTQIRWFSFEDLKKEHKQFRSFYQNIVSMILEKESGIEEFIRRSLKTKTKTRMNKTRMNKRTRKYRH
jgi:transcription termination factor NusB